MEGILSVKMDAELIEGIKRAEEEGEKVVEKARREAEFIVSKARKDAAKIADDNLKDIKNGEEEILRDSRQRIEKKKEALFAKCDKEIKKLQEKAKSNSEKTTELVLKRFMEST